MKNPYLHLRSLLDTTRHLDAEEMAELQLEQGYVERAAAIYDRLAREQPGNRRYAQRREWLRRLVAVQPPPRRATAPPPRPAGAPGPTSPPSASVDTTLRGLRAPGRGALEDALRPTVPAPEPTLPGPALCGPALCGPALPGPALPEPALPEPTLPGPALPGPALPGPVAHGPALRGPGLRESTPREAARPSEHHARVTARRIVRVG